MYVDIKTLLIEFGKTVDPTAERSLLASRADLFFENMAKHEPTASNSYFLSAVVFSDYDFSDSSEYQEIKRLIDEGYFSGIDEDGVGAFSFDITRLS